MKFLVTGGAGFIGSNFVKYLLKQNEYEVTQIVVVDKLTYAGKKENLVKEARVKLVQSDICEIAFFEDLITQSDYVVNFAAETHVDRSIQSAESFINSNIVGVQKLLDTVLRVKPSIRFLQVSTDEVYGSISTGSWTEEHVLEPNSPYAASKASADLLVRAYFKTHGLNVVTTRCSNNFGPAQDIEKFIPKIITNAIQNIPIPIYGKGENIRDWLFVEDHCRAILACLLKGESGEIYNIAGEYEASNNSIVKTVQEIMNFDENLITYVGDRKGHDFRYSVSSEKIRHKLGFTPVTSFKQGMAHTVNWYISNQDQWRTIREN